MGAPGARGPEVQLVKDRGTFKVPVHINDLLDLAFTVDSGASNVIIPDEIVSELRRSGSLRDTDFLGRRSYILADGSTMKADTFLLRSIRVGDWIVDDVLASNGGSTGSVLLGQSCLSRFRAWSIDNTREVLILE